MGITGSSCFIGEKHTGASNEVSGASPCIIISWSLLAPGHGARSTLCANAHMHVPNPGFCCASVWRNSYIHVGSTLGHRPFTSTTRHPQLFRPPFPQHLSGATVVPFPRRQKPRCSNGRRFVGGLSSRGGRRMGPEGLDGRGPSMSDTGPCAYSCQHLLCQGGGRGTSGPRFGLDVDEGTCGAGEATDTLWPDLPPCNLHERGRL